MTALAEPSRDRSEVLVFALDLASDALVTVGARGAIEHMNRAAEELLGVGLSAVAGRTVSVLFEDSSEDGVDAPSALDHAFAERCTREGLVKGRNSSTLVRYELHTESARNTGAVLRLFRTKSGELEGVNAILSAVVHDSRESDRRDAFDSDDRFINELDGILSHAGDDLSVFVRVSAQIAEHLNLQRCAFIDISAARNEVTVHPGYEKEPTASVGTVSLDAFGQETRAWLLAGRIVVTTDTVTDPRTKARYDSAYAPLRIRASVAVPLLRAGVCVGALSCTSTTPRNWTARELALLHAVAMKTWLFIEHRCAVKTQEALVEQLRGANWELERRVEERTAELTSALLDRETLLVLRDRAAEQLRRTIEASPTGMLMISLDGRIEMVNAKSEAIFGYERGELVGKPIELLTGNPSLFATEGTGGASGPLFLESKTVAGLRKDGTRVPVQLDVNPLETAEGRFILASVTDITERVAAERALRENEARYRRLFHDSPTALCEQDFSQVRAYLDELVAGGVGDLAAYLRAHPDAVAAAARRVRFTEVNDATLEMYEAESKAEIIRNWHKLFDLEMLKVFVEELCFLIEGDGSTFAARTASRTLKGRRNEIAFRLSVLPGSERTWARLVASIFDMTAYHDAERKLHAALREKDVLLKEVHHRVKNNLQVISSLLSLQAQHVADDSTRAVFASSQGRVQSIALVHEKLYQSRDLSHVKFAEYLETLTNDLLSAHSAKERGISSVLDVADLSLPVDVAVPCGLIVNELVSNALKHAFSTKTSGTVTVRAQRPRPELIELTVADDGSGLPQLLDPRDTSSLGLDLVFTFAEQLGAEVEITRNVGTRFVFRFREEAS